MASCFVTNLLQRVLSSTINFFMSFHIGCSDEKVGSDKVIRSNHNLVYQDALDLES